MRGSSLRAFASPSPFPFFLSADIGRDNQNRLSEMPSCTGHQPLFFLSLFFFATGAEERECCARLSFFFFFFFFFFRRHARPCERATNAGPRPRWFPCASVLLLPAHAGVSNAGSTSPSFSPLLEIRRQLLSPPFFPLSRKPMIQSGSIRFDIVAACLFK